MKYSDLVDVYERLDSDSKRLSKTLVVSQLLEKVPEDDIEKITLLLEGRAYPAWDERELGVAKQMMLKAVSAASGLDARRVESEWKRTGDLGEVAENLIKSGRQSTLVSHELTVSKVFENLRKLPEMTGQGSVDRKVQLIAELLTSAKPREARYIVRTVLGTLRVGVGAGVLRDAIAWAFFPKVKGLFPELDARGYMRVLKAESADELKNLQKYDAVEAPDQAAARLLYRHFVDSVQQAYDMANDFGVVASAAKSGGLAGLKAMSLKVGKPVKVMLSLKVDSAEEGFERCGTPMQAEFKLDGFRVQLHKQGSKVWIFTRRLEDVTRQFPDIVDSVLKRVHADSCILDAEAVGFDPSAKKYLPFQNVSQRIRRKYNIERMVRELPVEVNVFDVLLLDGRSMVDEPFRMRREAVEQIVRPVQWRILPAKCLVASGVGEVERFFAESKAAGNEGLMFKSLDAPYKPGARVGHMVKFKKTMENLDLVIVKAEWGEGKRSKWLSSYTVACRLGSKLLEIGKVSTGLKEKPEEGLSFGEMTKLLRPLIVSGEGKLVAIRPEVVIEVAYEEIQKSPTYESGYALRFPRVVRLREDKGPDDASSLKMVEQYYRGQKG